MADGTNEQILRIFKTISVISELIEQSIFGDTLPWSLWDYYMFDCRSLKEKKHSWLSA